MKTTCPKCSERFNVEDETILDAIRHQANLRAKAATLIGQMTGGKTKLDAEARRKRAIKAVQARESKRKASGRPAD